jgi:hypothetical protein
MLETCQACHISPVQHGPALCDKPSFIIIIIISAAYTAHCLCSQNQSPLSYIQRYT